MSWTQSTAHQWIIVSLEKKIWIWATVFFYFETSKPKWSNDDDDDDDYNNNISIKTQDTTRKEKEKKWCKNCRKNELSIENELKLFCELIKRGINVSFVLKMVFLLKQALNTSECVVHCARTHLKLNNMKRYFFESLVCLFYTVLLLLLSFFAFLFRIVGAAVVREARAMQR